MLLSRRNAWQILLFTYYRAEPKSEWHVQCCDLDLPGCTYDIKALYRTTIVVPGVTGVLRDNPACPMQRKVRTSDMWPRNPHKLLQGHG